MGGDQHNVTDSSSTPGDGVTPKSRLSDAELRMLLAPFVRRAWPVGRLLRLYRIQSSDRPLSDIGNEMGTSTHGLISELLHAFAVAGLIPERTSCPRLPDTRQAALESLWNWRGPDGERHSTVEIGLRLGITKNAVVGTVTRLVARGVLTGRGTPKGGWTPKTPRIGQSHPLEGAAEFARAVRVTRPAVPKRLPPVALNHPLAARPATPAPPPAPPPVIYATAYRGRISECCWPQGDPGTREFRFCDEPSEPGRSYCALHNGRAHIKERGHAAPEAGTGAFLAGTGP